MADLVAQASDLALHANTALPLAYATPMSEAADFYGSSAFASYRKSLEGQQKITQALFGRLDGLAKQVNVLAKVLARPRH